MTTINRQQIQLPIIPTRNTVHNVYMPGGAGASTRLRGKRPTSSGILQGRGRKRARRGFYPLSPILPGIVAGDNRLGTVVGAGIGSILAKGLSHVAKKGGEIVKSAAKKHGRRVVKQLKKSGTKSIASSVHVAPCSLSNICFLQLILT